MPPGLTSPADVMIIVVLALLLLGPEKLIEVAGSAGKLLAQARRWTEELSAQVRDTVAVDEPPPASMGDITAPALSAPSGGAVAAENERGDHDLR